MLRCSLFVKAAAKYIDYPLNYQYVAFYYAGLGGIDDSGREYIQSMHLTRRDGVADILYIGEYILSLFQLDHRGHRKYLFFLDCCLNNDPKLSPQGALSEYVFNLKHPSNALVAYATYPAHDSKSAMSNGGIWTHHLYKNLTTADSLTNILDLTKNDVIAEMEKDGIAKEKIRLNYSTDLDPVYLKGMCRVFVFLRAILID